MSDCRDAIDITSFLRGSLNKIKPCEKLRILLDIDLPYVPYPTILVSLYRRMNENKDEYLPIPLQLAEHFSPHKEITKMNALDVLAHHCRYPQPDLKYIFVNPKNIPTITINDMEPHPMNNRPIEKPEIDDAGFCETCGAFLKKENYDTHVAKACFAEYHNLHEEPCLELKMILALNVFAAHGGPRVQCTICDEVYSTIVHNEEITEHALTHANKFLRAEENLFEAREKLWQNLMDMAKIGLQICVPCQRYFTNPRMYYLHLALFEHGIDKNICTSCKECYNTQMLGHFKDTHPLDVGCPFACVCSDPMLPHHIVGQHRQYNHAIPQIEAVQIRNVIEGLNFTNKIYGYFGTVTFDRSLILQTKAACSSPTYGLNVRNRYEKIDLAGWQVSKNITNARYKQKKIRKEYMKSIKINAFRFISKILLQERFDITMIKREEHPELIFHTSIQQPEENVFPSEFPIRYTMDLIQNTDVILFGNDTFNAITSTPQGIKVLNISTRQDTIWNCRSFGARCPQTEISFNDFILKNVKRIDKECEHTIVIEASLRPILNEIDPQQRVIFLQNNNAELARSYLAMVCEVQKRFKNTAATTYLHGLYSPHYAEELPLIYEYNEYIRVGALRLELGLIELDTAQIYPLKINNCNQFFRMNAQLSRPFCDRLGNLTPFGQDSIKEILTNFEKEKTILLNQIQLNEKEQ